MISLTIFEFFHDCVLMIHHYRIHLLIKNEIEQRLNSDMIKNYNLSTKWLSYSKYVKKHIWSTVYAS